MRADAKPSVLSVARLWLRSPLLWSLYTTGRALNCLGEALAGPGLRLMKWSAARLAAKRAPK